MNLLVFFLLGTSCFVHGAVREKRWSIGGALSSVSNAAGAVKDAAIKPVQGVASTVSGKVTETLEAGVSATSNLVSSAASVAGDAVSNVGEKVNAGVDSASSLLPEGVVGSVSNGISAGSKLAGGLTGGIKDLVQQGSQVAGNVADHVGSSVSNIKETVVGGASAITSGVGSVVSNVVNATKEAGISAAQLTFKTLLKLSNKALDLGVNTVVDKFKDFLEATHMDILPLPPIYMPMAIGKFEASGGHCKGLLSMGKCGQVVAKEDNGTLLIVFPVHMDELEIGYDEFAASSLGIAVKGNFSALVKKNKVDVQVRLSMGTSCAISLDKVNVEELGGLEIKIEGLCRLCNLLSSSISSWVANFTKEKITVTIEKAFDTLLQNMLKTTGGTICSKFMNP